MSDLKMTLLVVYNRRTQEFGVASENVMDMFHLKKNSKFMMDIKKNIPSLNVGFIIFVSFQSILDGKEEFITEHKNDISEAVSGDLNNIDVDAFPLPAHYMDKISGKDILGIAFASQQMLLMCIVDEFADSYKDRKDANQIFGKVIGTDQKAFISIDTMLRRLNGRFPAMKMQPMDEDPIKIYNNSDLKFLVLDTATQSSSGSVPQRTPGSVLKSSLKRREQVQAYSTTKTPSNVSFSEQYSNSMKTPGVDCLSDESAFSGCTTNASTDCSTIELSTPCQRTSSIYSSCSTDDLDESDVLDGVEVLLHSEAKEPKSISMAFRASPQRLSSPQPTAPQSELNTEVFTHPLVLNVHGDGEAAEDIRKSISGLVASSVAEQHSVLAAEKRCKPSSEHAVEYYRVSGPSRLDSVQDTPLKRSARTIEDISTVGSDVRDFKADWAVMRSVVGWQLMWLRHAGAVSVDEFYVTPYAVQIGKRHSKVLGSYGGLIENLNFFMGKDALSAHCRAHPWLSETFPQLFRRMRAVGWDRVDGSEKDVDGGRESVYQLLDMPQGVERVWGVHQFGSMLAVMQYIARFPFLLADDARLGETLQQHGWARNKDKQFQWPTEDDSGICWTASGSSSRYVSVAEVRRRLWVCPRLLFVHSGDIDPAHLLEAIKLPMEMSLMGEKLMASPLPLGMSCTMRAQSANSLHLKLTTYYKKHSAENVAKGAVFWGSFSQDELDLHSDLAALNWLVDPAADTHSTDVDASLKQFFFVAPFARTDLAQQWESTPAEPVVGKNCFWHLYDIAALAVKFGPSCLIHEEDEAQVSVRFNLQSYLGKQHRQKLDDLILAFVMNSDNAFLHFAFLRLLQHAGWAALALPSKETDEPVTPAQSALPPPGEYLFIPPSARKTNVGVDTYRESRYEENRDYFLSRDAVLNHITAVNEAAVAAVVPVQDESSFSSSESESDDEDEVCDHCGEHHTLGSAAQEMLGEVIRYGRDLLKGPVSNIDRRFTKVWASLRVLGWSCVYGLPGGIASADSEVYLASWSAEVEGAFYIGKSGKPVIKDAAKLTRDVDYFLSKASVLTYVLRRGTQRRTEDFPVPVRPAKKAKKAVTSTTTTKPPSALAQRVVKAKATPSKKPLRSAPVVEEDVFKLFDCTSSKAPPPPLSVQQAPQMPVEEEDVFASCDVYSQESSASSASPTASSSSSQRVVFYLGKWYAEDSLEGGLVTNLKKFGSQARRAQLMGGLKSVGWKFCYLTYDEQIFLPPWCTETNSQHVKMTKSRFYTVDTAQLEENLDYFHTFDAVRDYVLVRGFDERLTADPHWEEPSVSPQSTDFHRKRKRGSPDRVVETHAKTVAPVAAHSVHVFNVGPSNNKLTRRSDVPVSVSSFDADCAGEYFAASPARGRVPSEKRLPEVLKCISFLGREYENGSAGHHLALRLVNEPASVTWGTARPELQALGWSTNWYLSPKATYDQNLNLFLPPWTPLTSPHIVKEKGGYYSAAAPLVENVDFFLTFPAVRKYLLARGFDERRTKDVSQDVVESSRQANRRLEQKLLEIENKKATAADERAKAAADKQAAKKAAEKRAQADAAREAAREVAREAAREAKEAEERAAAAKAQALAEKQAEKRRIAMLEAQRQEEEAQRTIEFLGMQYDRGSAEYDIAFMLTHHADSANWVKTRHLFSAVGWAPRSLYYLREGCGDIFLPPWTTKERLRLSGKGYYSAAEDMVENVDYFLSFKAIMEYCLHRGFSERRTEDVKSKKNNKAAPKALTALKPVGDISVAEKNVAELKSVSVASQRVAARQLQQPAAGSAAKKRSIRPRDAEVLLHGEEYRRGSTEHEVLSMLDEGAHIAEVVEELKLLGWSYLYIKSTMTETGIVDAAFFPPWATDDGRAIKSKRMTKDLASMEPNLDYFVDREQIREYILHRGFVRREFALPDDNKMRIGQKKGNAGSKSASVSAGRSASKGQSGEAYVISKRDPACALYKAEDPALHVDRLLGGAEAPPSPLATDLLPKFGGKTRYERDEDAEEEQEEGGFYAPSSYRPRIQRNDSYLFEVEVEPSECSDSDAQSEDVLNHSDDEPHESPLARKLSSCSSSSSSSSSNSRSSSGSPHSRTHNANYYHAVTQAAVEAAASPEVYHPLKEMLSSQNPNFERIFGFLQQLSPKWTKRNLVSKDEIAHLEKPAGSMDVMTVYLRPRCRLSSGNMVMNEDYFYSRADLLEYLKLMMGITTIPYYSERNLIDRTVDTTPASAIKIRPEVTEENSHTLTATTDVSRKRKLSVSGDESEQSSAVTSDNFRSLVNATPVVSAGLTLEQSIHEARGAFKNSMGHLMFSREGSGGGSTRAYVRPQTLDIYETVTRSLASAQGSSVYIWGSTGQGKTLAVNSILAQIRYNRCLALGKMDDSSEHSFLSLPELSSAELGLDVVTTSNKTHLFESIAEQLGLACQGGKDKVAEAVMRHFRTRAAPLDASYRADWSSASVTKKVKIGQPVSLRDARSAASAANLQAVYESNRHRGHRMTVLFVDEVNMAGHGEVAQLLQLVATQRDCSLIVLATCNVSHADYHNALSEKAKAFHHASFQQVHAFAALSQKDLTRVLESRAQGLFHSNAVRLLVMRGINALNGDVRLFLEMCSECLEAALKRRQKSLTSEQLTAELAGAAKPVVDMVVVNAVSSRPSSELVDTLRALHLNSQLLLTAILVNRRASTSGSAEEIQRFDTNRLISMYSTEWYNLYKQQDNFTTTVQVALDDLVESRLVRQEKKKGQVMYHALVSCKAVLAAATGVFPEQFINLLKLWEATHGQE